MMVMGGVVGLVRSANVLKHPDMGAEKGAELTRRKGYEQSKVTDLGLTVGWQQD